MSVTLSSTTSATLRSTPIQNDSILIKNACCLWGVKKKKNFSDFTASTPTKKPLPCFQSISLPRSPPSLSAECQVSLGLNLSFFFLGGGGLFDFHVDVISELCLWLSLFVFNWLTQCVGFSTNHGHSHWLSCWKEKEESAVSKERGWGGERGRGKKANTA